MDASQLTNLRRAKTLYADSLAQKQQFNSGVVTRIHALGNGLHNSYLLEGAIFTGPDSYKKIVDVHTPVTEQPSVFYIESIDVSPIVSNSLLSINRTSLDLMANAKVDNLDFNEEDDSIKVFPSEELKDSLFQEHDISGNNLQNGDLPDATAKKNYNRQFYYKHIRYSLCCRAAG